MGWVVKQWRMEALERLLSDDARAAVESARVAAGRDARRARRAADRTAAHAAAELAALERLGVELHAMVHARRAAPGCVPSTTSEPRGPAAPALPGGSTEALPGASAEAPPGASAQAPPGVAEETPAAADFLPGPPPRRRPPRASLRSSALAELFRATAPR